MNASRHGSLQRARFRIAAGRDHPSPVPSPQGGGGRFVARIAKRSGPAFRRSLALAAFPARVRLAAFTGTAPSPRTVNSAGEGRGGGAPQTARAISLSFNRRPAA